MRAQRAVVKRPGEVALESFRLTQPAPGQAILRAHVTLISPGTERAFFLALPNANAAYPLYPGYSLIGEVLAIGEGVDQIRVGDRVACAAPHASHAIVKAADCQPVPDSLSDENAVFFNLLAIAMQGARKARIELGEAVAVLGAGLIGLFAMRLAQLSGGLPVVGIDIDEERLALAEGFGADSVMMGGDGIQRRFREELGADGASVVIEATGHPDLVVTAFQLAAAGGRVVLLGSTRGETASVNFYRDVHRKGVQVIGSHEITRPLHEDSPGYWTRGREHRVCLDLLARDRVAADALITHRFNWRDFPEAYAKLNEWDNRALGMVINWT